MSPAPAGSCCPLGRSAHLGVELRLEMSGLLARAPRLPCAVVMGPCAGDRGQSVDTQALASPSVPSLSIRGPHVWLKHLYIIQA